MEMNIERSFSNDVTLEKLLSFLKKNKIASSISFPDGYIENQPGACVSVYLTDYTDAFGNAIRGNGKGQGAQIYLSAYFEAFEHKAIHYQSPPNYLQSIEQLLRNKYLAHHPAFEYWLINQNVNEIIKCYKYNDFAGNEYLLPGFLSYLACNKTISKNEQLASKYFSSNGYGVGLNFRDAILHSIMEIIERDALAQFVYRNYFGKTIESKSQIKIPVRRSLIEEIRKYEEFNRTRLSIFETTSDNGVPSFYACSKINIGKPVIVRGSGASYDVSYAVERAIYECFQALYLYDEAQLNDDFAVSNFLSEFPNYLKFQKAAKITEIPVLLFEADDDNNATSGNLPYLLPDHLLYDKIVKDVGKTNKIFYRIVEKNNLFTIVHTVIPEYDDVLPVLDGIVRMPSRRSLQTIYK